MRNLKKFLALVLATLMVVSAAATVSAFDDVAEDNQYAAAIDKLVEYGITNGVDESNFAPDNDVERYQMALFMARALKPGETDWSNGMEIFDDVEEYYGAIAFAYTEGIVTGIGNNLFAPHDGIRYQDALIMALRALGYEVDVTGDPYWLAAYTKASEIGLTKNVAVTKGEKTLTRAETAQVIYNMLKAVPADGGATIEEKNFGVAGVNNVTTIIVSATEKQQYNKAAKPAETGYVGTQLLVNGIPTGEVRYYPAALLGIAADEIEDSFAHAFDLVNYDAETDTFDKVVPGLDPVVVAGKNVGISGEKISIDSVPYYPVDEITGAPLKNEIVVYTGGSTAGNSITLVVDKDGNVIDANGEITAAKAVTINGTTLYLYDGAFHTESEALAVWGISLPGASVTYSTYDASQLAALKNNYQISLYDDNRDGKYDRATVATLYMDVYTPAKDGKEQFGQMNGKDKVTYTTTLSKGDVFTYTYNADTKVVNVVEVLTPDSGVLTKINTTNINQNDAGKSTYKSVVVTVDGKDYVLANAERVAAGYVGAIVTVTDGAEFNKIKDKAVMDYVDWTDLVIGSTLNFVAYGDTIIAAQSKAAGDPYTKVIIKEATSFDTECIYVDAYVNGLVVKDIAVSSVKIGGKTTKFADLSIFAFSTTVSDLVNNKIKLGAIFQARENADGTVSLTDTTYANEYAQTVDDQGTLKFKGGIADNLSNADAVRTNSSTVFYFIGSDGVKTLIGSPADDKTIDLSKATVYADKLGYGTNSNVNGVSGTVVVLCNKDVKITDATNIFTAVSATSTVMVLNESALTFVKATAETLGLSGNDIYRAYNVNAINLNTGDKVSTIYVKESNGAPVVELAKGTAYTVISGTNVIDKADAVATVKELNNVTRASFTEARNWTIAGLSDYTKLTKVVLTGVAKYDTKTNPNDVLADGKIYTVYYVTGKDATTFVGVAVEGAKPTTKTVTITASGFVGTSSPVTVVAKVGTEVVKELTIPTDGTYTFTFDAKADWVGVSGNGTFTWTDTTNYSTATVNP